ncbi:dihydrodipicolinate synthase [Catonella morbi ATCC 51271]|uniref:4-hydroxy-tetrahydrodipicolinate synthase n=1 Tax=Catonella morbi ATCC 51271 TaxID=592026 RepID=V2Y5R2_9FIRM|nr:4-hydroxy-tetrahydrodipicolinate synthase [Catonella morbi]ESL03432.1 dihydrodipicolinate synthase [Catonella morbi ATCC 51271]
MSIFEGVATALITPFGPDGSVNYAKLEELINKQIEDGVDGLVICGTTGESATLTEKEHMDVIRESVKFVNSRVPVIAGTGSNCTQTAIEMSKEAEEYGADGLLLVSPYYNKATAEGMYEHFADTANAVNIPVILYNIPGRTGVNIDPETIYRLARDVKNIVAVKEASGNISNIAKIAALTAGLDFDIYSGNDDQVVALCAMGGKGVISVVSHIIPKEMHDLVMSFRNGDTKKALEIQNKYLSLINTLFIDVNPIPVKEAMNLLGYEVGGYRKPLTPMSDAHREILRKELINVGLLK